VIRIASVRFLLLLAMPGVTSQFGLVFTGWSLADTPLSSPVRSSVLPHLFCVFPRTPRTCHYFAHITGISAIGLVLSMRNALIASADAGCSLILTS
jgi:hypothetical protein